MVSYAGGKGLGIFICVTLSLWPGKGFLQAKEDEEKHLVRLGQSQERISRVVYHGHVALAQSWSRRSRANKAFPMCFDGYGNFLSECRH